MPSDCAKFSEGRCWDALCPEIHPVQSDAIECWYSRLYPSRGELCWRQDCPFVHVRGTRDPELDETRLARGRAVRAAKAAARRIAWHRQEVVLAKHCVKSASNTVSQRRLFLRREMARRRRAARSREIYIGSHKLHAAVLAQARRLEGVARDVLVRAQADLARETEQWPDLAESDIEGVLSSPVWEYAGSDVEQEAMNSAGESEGAE